MEKEYFFYHIMLVLLDIHRQKKYNIFLTFTSEFTWKYNSYVVTELDLNHKVIMINIEKLK